jgi:hypothetical protein
VPRDEQRREADAGRRVALAGLTHEPLLGDAGQLPADGVEETRRGHHHRPLRGDEPVEPLHGVGEQRLLPGQREELLGEGGAAGGPESRARASRHDDRMQH